MKKTLLSIIAVLTMVAAQAQLGQVNFNNRVSSAAPPIDARVNFEDGTPVVGAEFRAQLGVVNGTSVTLIPSSITTFRTTPAAALGYITGVIVDLPGTTPGQNVTVRMVAFNGADFDSSTLRGESNDVTLSLGGGGTLLPANMVGLEGFEVVPEPSTIALGILGAAALLIRRRK